MTMAISGMRSRFCRFCSSRFFFRSARLPSRLTHILKRLWAEPTAHAHLRLADLADSAHDKKE